MRIPKTNAFKDPDGKDSLMRTMSFMLVAAGIFVAVFGFIEAREAFDIMMVSGMLIGAGLTGKLVQAPMERSK